jgi:hypothetical protein
MAVRKKQAYNDGEREKTMIIAFIIWTAVSLSFLVIAYITSRKETPAGFFSNEKEPPKVKDIRGYNQALSRLWIGFAILFELLGLPFLFFRQNSPAFLIPGLGVPFLCIGLIILYLNILSKYQI